MNSNAVRIGVDLGGTKIEVIALSASGQTLLRRRQPTPTGDYAGTLDTLCALVKDAERDLGVTATVGIGMPGALSLLSGLVKNANSTVLNSKPLKRDLERQLGRELRFENDANCFAMSEAVDGAGRDADVVFGVILGTGVGGGLIVNRRVISGAARIAGEWGHNPLPPAAQRGLLTDVQRRMAAAEQPGPACYCGRFGCIETWLSGPGFAADYDRNPDGRNPDGREPTAKAAAGRDARAVIARAQAGDAAAHNAWVRYVDRLARSLATVINIVDPQVIVLGGGLSGIAGLADAVASQLPAYVFSDEVRTEVRVNHHGDSSGVRGAAWLWGGPQA